MDNEEYTVKDRIMDTFSELVKAILFIIFMIWVGFAVWLWKPHMTVDNLLAVINATINQPSVDLKR